MKAKLVPKSEIIPINPAVSKQMEEDWLEEKFVQVTNIEADSFYNEIKNYD